MKDRINKFYGFNKNSFFHIFIHVGFIMAIAWGLFLLGLAYFSG